MKVNLSKQWSHKSAELIYKKPFSVLLSEAHEVLSENFDPTKIQLTTLLNVKTGGCPEDCAYCPQSAHYNTGVGKEKLWDLEDVREKVKQAKQNGATRFCLVTAWRSPPKQDLPALLEMVKIVKQEGLECCTSLGMLSDTDAQKLKSAGVDFYNHNLDSSREFYNKIIQTRSYDDRLKTLEHVQDAGMNVCCGGIIGMGESIEDRINLLIELTRLKKPPDVVTINILIPIPGTPLEDRTTVDPIEHVRFVALARIMLPTSTIRLSAGRNNMSELHQAISFFAGANSVIAGDKYLTQSLHDISVDHELLAKLNMGVETNEMSACS
jgi:biotin synthase